MAKVRAFEIGLIAGLEEAGVSARGRLLVAVSGGPDSMALLAGLAEARRSRPAAVPELAAAHFNHRLRGPESEGDARFVAGYCREHQIPCELGTGDVQEYRRSRGVSLEAAARLMRYGFLADAARKLPAQAVATAHTLDDQAETVLLHITRGSGTRGLAGMRPRTVIDQPGGGTLTVVRPMLRLRKSDAEAYCRELGIRPRRDPSNEDPAIPRNRIRNAVMPELAKINPDVASAIARLADTAARDLAWLDKHVDAAWHDTADSGEDGAVSLDREGLGGLDPAISSRLVQRAWESLSGTPDGLEAAHVRSVLDLLGSHTGSRAVLPGGVTASLDYDRVRLQRRSANAAGDGRCPYPAWTESVSLHVPGVARLGATHELVADELTPAEVLKHGEPRVAYLDAAAVGRDLTIRPRRDGDRFQPLGMAGEKKIQDFFVDERVPRAWRQRIPLVDTPRGIAWVAGLRPAHWARVTDETRTAIRLELRTVR